MGSEIAKCQPLNSQVLSFTNESLAKFKAASCHKKSGHDLSRITPLHCAAINPNPTYLKQVRVHTNYRNEKKLRIIFFNFRIF